MAPDQAENLAARLLAEFRSLARVWSQDSKAIERVAGRGSPVGPLLIAARAVMEEAMRSDLRRGSVHPAQPRLLDYLKASMGGLPDENLRILFLSGSHGLLADEQMQQGTIGQIAVYPRVIFRRAIELDAAALILVHNHPSGDPTPSPNDVGVTGRLVELGQSLGVEIVEHIVVTATEHRFILGHRGSRATGEARPLELRAGGAGPGDEGYNSDANAAAEAPKESAANNLAALANARRTARRRLLRRQLIGAEHLFGEPAWDMLIELFIHEVEGKPISTSSLGIASGMSASSGLRLVQNLVDAGLVVREEDPGDGRRTLISLSPATVHRLTAFFATHEE